MVEVIKRTSESYSDAFKARVVNGAGTEDTITPKVVIKPQAKITPAVTKEEPPKWTEEKLEELPVLSAQTLLEMETGRKNLEKYKLKG
jgi:hypothetical protein